MLGEIEHMKQEELDSLVDLHQLWIASGGKEGSRMDLSGVSLRGLRLGKANLAKARFFDVIFTHAKFANITFRETEFSQCDFSFTDFSNCTIHKSKVLGSVFHIAMFFDSTFSASYFEDSIFLKVTYSGNVRMFDNEFVRTSFEDTMFYEINEVNLKSMKQLREIYDKAAEDKEEDARLQSEEEANHLRQQEESNMQAEQENEIKEIQKRINSSKMSPEHKEKMLKEAKKLASMPPVSAEATTQRVYIDHVLSIPWGIQSELKSDLAFAEQVLNEDHYGLEKVKERVLEYLAVNQYTKSAGSGGTVLCLYGPPGVGKCLGKGTPVIMYDGTTKKVEDVNVGDVLMGDDSKPRNVLSLARGRELMYKVTPVKGDSYIVNESHILSLKLDGKVKDVDVKTYLSSKQRDRHKGYRVGVEFSQSASESLLIDPYFLGAWLGDGNSNISAVTTMDSEIKDCLQCIADSSGLKLRAGGISGKSTTYHITSGVRGNTSLNTVQGALRRLGVINNKHIPHEYLVSSREERLQLLAGLIDTDGSLVNSGTGYDWISVGERLADDMLFLCRSLGFAAYKKPCKKRAKLKDGSYSKEGTYFRLSISGNLSEVPVRLTRKKANVRKQVKDVLVTGVTVTPIGEGDYYGFEIDGNRRFLLGDFTVTHNTSILTSISKATGREFITIALGGVSDEAEIRGHRRTYVGSMPGKIVNALKKAQTSNPVILLDEIDKMGSQHKGDPAAALLEVLDPAQNKKFMDNYIDMEVDLSSVMFIATANSLSSIPGPLRDRMEIVSLTGYTNSEKTKIGTTHLANKVLIKTGLAPAKLKFSEEAVNEIVSYYTREAGVRTLEKEMNRVCRKIVKAALDKKGDLVSGKSRNLGFKNSESGKRKIITKELVNQLLGPRVFEDELKNKKNEVGFAQGLAYTSVGGALVPVEVALTKGNGGLKVTGSLGEMMKESTQIAFTYVQTQSEMLGLSDDFFSKHNVHIHFPDGATPKDGSSAGLIIMTALTSAVTGIAYDREVAGTGEIDLRGNALPIGGVREKMFAAYIAGSSRVFLPFDNIKDLRDVSQEVKDKIHIKAVTRAEEVLLMALDFSSEKGQALKLKLEKALGINPEVKEESISQAL
jgi:ATP-dependent Lon protease